MTHVLEVLELADEHGVAEMEVGRGGIEAGLDPHRLAGRQGLFDALAQVALADDLGGAFAQIGDLFVNGRERGHRS